MWKQDWNGNDRRCRSMATSVYWSAGLDRNDGRLLPRRARSFRPARPWELPRRLGWAWVRRGEEARATGRRGAHLRRRCAASAVAVRRGPCSLPGDEVTRTRAWRGSPETTSSARQLPDPDPAATGSISGFCRVDHRRNRVHTGSGFVFAVSGIRQHPGLDPVSPDPRPGRFRVRRSDWPEMTGPRSQTSTYSGH